MSSGYKKKGRKRLFGKDNPFFGKTHSEDAKKKMGLRNIGNRYAWKGGKYNWLVKEAKVRDDYTCQDCGLDEEEIMTVDHIKPKSVFPELRNVLDNLITLCPNCHARKTLRDIKNYKITTVNRKKYVSPAND